MSACQTLTKFKLTSAAALSAGVRGRHPQNCGLSLARFAALQAWGSPGSALSAERLFCGELGQHSGNAQADAWLHCSVHNATSHPDYRLHNLMAQIPFNSHKLKVETGHYTSEA